MRHNNLGPLRPPSSPGMLKTSLNNASSGADCRTPCAEVAGTLTLISGEVGHGPFRSLVRVRSGSAVRPAPNRRHLEQARRGTSVLRLGALSTYCR